MKAYWTPIIFAAGLGVGWLIFGGGVRESAESAENKSAAPIVRKREPVKTPHESKFRSFAKELPKLSEEDKEAFKKSLAPKDRAAAIEAMLAQAGPDGISRDAKFMLGEILSIWAYEDFDGAWAWCRRLEFDANRNFVASQLLDGLSQDPDRAFALHLEMAALDPDFSSGVPFIILGKSASKDAASFLDLLEKLPFGNGSSKMAVHFAADFDFQQAADGVAALIANRDGKSPPLFPTNFLAIWAARDANAAYAWYSKNPSALTDETFSSLLEGIEKQGVPGASYAWAADKFSEPAADRGAIIRSLTRIGYDRMPTVINSIAQAMPDIANRDRFFGDVVTLSDYCSNAAVMYGFALTQMSSPATRLETLRRLAKDGHLHAAEIPDTFFQQWGLTRQQVEQAEASGR